MEGVGSGNKRRSGGDTAGGFWQRRGQLCRRGGGGGEPGRCILEVKAAPAASPMAAVLAACHGAAMQNVAAAWPVPLGCVNREDTQLD